MTIQYVKKWTVPLRSLADPKDKACTRKATLLWGDPVHLPEGWVPGSAGPVKVRARARSGWVDGSDLCDQGLLEIYVIDVGQGDSILIRTSDDRWHLIDGGASYRKQMTRKSVVDFLEWKFIKDLQAGAATLENVILSHPDDDHFGGLVDVFKGETNDETFPITIKNFYHNGLGRFDKAPEMGARVSAQVQAFPQGEHGLPTAGEFVTELLDGKNTFQENPARPFNTKGFGEFAALVIQIPQNVSRLSDRNGFLPGYGAGQNATTIRVLGPVLEDLGGGQLGLRYLQRQDSLTCNGHSVTLLLEYGDARILLAGDLNTDSQELLLSYHAANTFSVDVSKACHHGAEDVKIEFLQAMQARATVISSGDNEDFSHPRPALMGAVARYGRCAKDSKSKEILPPLIYSTELARSLKMAFPTALQLKEAGNTKKKVMLSTAEIKLKEDAYYRPLTKIPCSSKLVYGLVNIRTDGKHILCATMEEKGNNFDYKVFRAGVDV